MSADQPDDKKEIIDFIDPNSKQRTIIETGVPEEVVESTVLTMTTMNPDGSLNRTTKKTTRTTTTTTTVRKICISTGTGDIQAYPQTVPDASQEYLQEAAEFVTGNPNTILATINDSQQPQINTVSSEMTGPSGRTCATFAYMSPTHATNVEEVEEEDPLDGSKVKKVLRKTLITSAAATAVVKKDSNFTTKSTEATGDGLLRLRNLEADEGTIEDRENQLLAPDDQSKSVDEHDIETWISPDGNTTTKTVKRVIFKHNGEAIDPKTELGKVTTTTTRTKRKVLDRGSALAKSGLRTLKNVFGTSSVAASSHHASSEDISRDLSLFPFIPTDPFGHGPSIFDFDFNLIELELLLPYRKPDTHPNNQMEDISFSGRITGGSVFGEGKAGKLYIEKVLISALSLFNRDICDEDSAIEQMRQSEKRFSERLKAMQESTESRIRASSSSRTTHVTTTTTVSDNGQMRVTTTSKTSGSAFPDFSSMFAALPLYQGYGLLGKVLDTQEASVPKGDGEPSVDFSALLDPESMTKWMENFSSQFGSAMEPMPIDKGDGQALPEQDREATPKPKADPVRADLDPNSEILGEVSSGPFRIAWMDRPEAMFEVVTTEASYNQSLRVLVKHFYWANEFSCGDNPAEPDASAPDVINPHSEAASAKAVISALEKRHLFSNILCVFLSSSAFMRDLELRWQHTAPHLTEVCDIILAHVEEKNFDPYIMYLRNQAHQLKTLTKLNEREKFKEALERLQSDPIVQKHRLSSFLSLPMQRLMRLRLLVQTVAKLQAKVNKEWEQVESGQTSVKPKCKVTESELQNVQNASHVLDKLIRESESEKKNMDDKARLLELATTMEFPETMKALSIGDQKLIKEGEMRCYRHKSTMFRGKKYETLHLILLSENLIVTKFKKYKVIDYCLSSDLEPVLRHDADSPQASDLPNGKLMENGLTKTGSSSSLVKKKEGGKVLDLKMLHTQSNNCNDLQIYCTNERELSIWHQLFVKSSDKLSADKGSIM
ncbi:hypothetical protein Ciccas_001672 [Cichlidogyrus casuarinus]|uniref:DH domain-containing protein n=1 Tax=Cichlidogyrus casuarinus TaxID=1844966 RepID=A0ABD2QJC2_9PLAT